MPRARGKQRASQCDGIGLHSWDRTYNPEGGLQSPRYNETVEIVYLFCTKCPRTRWTEMDEYGQWVGHHHYGPSGWKRTTLNGELPSRAMLRLLWVGRKVMVP